jgi:hypothetical protein
MIACLKSVQSVDVGSCGQGRGRTVTGSKTECVSGLAEVDVIP